MDLNERLFWKRVLDEAPSWEQNPKLLHESELGYPKIRKPSRRGKPIKEYHLVRNLHLSAIRALRGHWKLKKSESQHGPSTYYLFSRRFAELIAFYRAGVLGQLSDADPGSIRSLWRRYQNPNSFQPHVQQKAIPGLRGWRVPPCPAGASKSAWKGCWRRVIDGHKQIHPGKFIAMWAFWPERCPEEAWMFAVTRNRLGGRDSPVIYMAREDGDGVFYAFSGRRGALWTAQPIRKMGVNEPVTIQVEDSEWTRPYISREKGDLRQKEFLALLPIYCRP
jgi:hypothetical protein